MFIARQALGRDQISCNQMGVALLVEIESSYLVLIILLTCHLIPDLAISPLFRFFSLNLHHIFSRSRECYINCFLSHQHLKTMYYICNPKQWRNLSKVKQSEVRWQKLRKFRY